MFPRSFRLPLIILFLLLIVFLSVTFRSSSAADDKGKSQRQSRFAQTSQTFNQSSHKAGPPNYDAFGASKKQAPGAAALAQQASQTGLQSGHSVQMEARLGVPTFLWASEAGKGQAKQLSADMAQAKTDIESTARGYLGDYGPSYRLSSEDVAAARLAAIHDTGKGVIIARFKQELGGVEVFRDEVNVIMNRELQLIALSGYLTGDDAGAALSTQGFALQPADALSAALQDLTGTAVSASAMQARGSKPSTNELSAAGGTTQNPYLLFTADKTVTKANDGGFAFAGDPARVKQVFYHTVDGYIPAYYVETDVLVPAAETNTVSLTGDAPTTELAYSYVISAVDGQVLFRKNLIDEVGTPFTYRVWVDPVTRIPFDTPAGNGVEPKSNALPDGAQFPFVGINDITLANYPFSRNDPWLAPGATETVGNNADAYVDLFNPDGFSPAGTPADPATADFRAQITAADQFLHTHTPDASPATAEARQGAIQQLFYNVNFLHDWYYDAGFDEAAGNAQFDNYGRGGLANDRLRAEAQDVSGRNNANMLTPADGTSPRMQMYLFDSNAIKYVDVLLPAAAAGQRAVGTGQIGPQVFDVTNDLVQPSSAAGCSAGDYAGASGKFVMVDREPTGSCSIGTKLNNAMAAGAAGFILVNLSTTPNQAVNVTGSLPSFTIPFLSISWNDAASIKTALAAPSTVTVRMRRDAGVDRDGAIDNQMVFHEWGHYLSNRLIANAAGLNTNLSSGMGEGWADFNAMLALTVRPDDINTPSNANWNGAYALATYATSGGNNNGYYYGIRRYPYSTDMTKNPLTFKHIQDGTPLPGSALLNPNAGGANSEVHNTGEVWATMLWECYASLLRDTLGQTPRLTFREAQERMKNYLVSALKMTPPQPTFLEARDALLASAKAYDITDYSLFIQAFAKRGAGVGAVSPDRFTLDNVGVTESYDAIPEVTFAGATLDDSGNLSCDNDGVVDSGETGTLTINFKNIGSTTLTGTTATINPLTPGVTLPNGNTINIPSYGPLGIGSGEVSVKLANGLAGAQQLDFQISYSDPQISGGARTANVSFRGNTDLIPASTATDTVEAPTTLWTVTSVPPTVTSGGFTSTWGAKTPWRSKEVSALQHVWHVDDIGLWSDERLTSPIFTVDGSGAFNLQFDHSWGFEFDGGGNYDGGVIEFSVNGGAFVDFGGPAYNGVILNYGGANNPNPLKGRNGFVKNSGGTIHTSLTQAIAPGSTVQIRFRVGSDGGFGSTGWDVDNITFNGVVETPFSTLVAESGFCDFNPPPPTGLQLSPNTLPQGTINSPYPTTTLVASGGNGSYTYAITPFALPQGLVYDVVGGNLQISGTPLRAGSFPVTVVVNDTAGHQQSFNYTLTINKLIPAVTWNNPADVTYGTALDGTQLNASANVPGTFTYTPPPGTVLNAGSNQTLSVTFTPTDIDTYSNVTQTVQINVLKVTPTMTWGNPADITYGTPLDATQLKATASVPGTITYTPAAGAVLDVGNNQTLTVNFTPADTTNYNSASKNVSINVLKATPVITWSSPADITYGTALTATQLNATGSVPGTITFTPPAGTLLSVGNNQTLTANLTPTDTVHYNSASKNVSVNVLKANQTISFGALANKVFGDAPFNLSATSSSGLPVVFSIASGPASLNGNLLTITGAGTVTVHASVAPDGNYHDATPIDQSFMVAKANQAINFGALPGKTFGDAPFNVSAASTSGLPVVFSIFSGPATISGNTVTITGAGTVTVRAAVVTDANYNNAAPVDQSFTVAKADQTITFGALPSRTFGDAAFNLGATSSSGLPVSFSRVSGPVSLSGNTVTITGVGHVVVRASQTGTGNYNAASDVDQAFDVANANANIALSNLAYTYDGTAKAATVTTTPAGLSFTLVYSQNNVPVAAPTNAGSYAVTATITDPNYQGSVTGTLVINKATPVVTWANPANIVFGTPLGATQLNATGSVPGAFQYSLPAGTVLSVGTYQLSTSFTPADAANYNSVSQSVALTVDPAPLPALSFTSPAYVVNENAGGLSITVNRGGDTSFPVTVNYATSDTAGLNPCSLVNGVASSRCDYATTAGTLRFAAGETAKTISIPLVDDGFSEGAEGFTISLSNPSSGATLGVNPTATIAITDNDASNGANPVTSPAFFVRQQYIDFLGREPDPVGYQGWQDSLNHCAAGDTRCDRIEVSAGFFRSEEFQARGGFIYRFYAASLGRIPHYAEFISDLAKVSGFLTPEQLEANKAAFVAEFMSRAEFQTKYGALTDPTAYVDGLLQTAGLPNHPSRAAWIAGLTNATLTRAQVLRALIESTEVYNKFYNEAFVVMQYFGYLRRDPDIHYLEWIQIMNQNGGDYRAMISGFLNSNEYVLRFGN